MARSTTTDEDTPAAAPASAVVTGAAPAEVDACKGKDKADASTTAVDNEDAGKRQREDPHSDDDDTDDSENTDGDNDNQETVDVDFDFNDPCPIDFHGIKTLLRQTFATDIEKVDASALADAIIDQSHVGSTVKVDEDDLDPYALLTVLNLTHHSTAEWARQLTSYILGKSASRPKTHKQLAAILTDTSAHVGFVVNERLVNMPPQLAPTMFKLLSEEIQAAIAEKQPFSFKYLVFIAKVYKEVESTLDEEEAGEDASEVTPNDKTSCASLHSRKRAKKSKKASSSSSEPIQFYMQPEDEIIQRHATITVDYTLPKQQSSDSRRAFHDVGIEMSRRLLVVEFDRMDQTVREIGELFDA